ncbi:MAG: hypothetical protein WCC84_14990 [Candidatus Cybelea sp.]
MRLLTSTLYSLIAMSLLAACSGNMATTPSAAAPGAALPGSAAVPNAARLIADTQNRSASGHNARNLSYETVALQMNNWDTGPGPYYVTAAGPPIAEPNCGSGQVALHDDATTIGPEEKYIMVNEGTNGGNPVVAFQLLGTPYYITAVNGGDVGARAHKYGYSQLHTNNRSVGLREKFEIIQGSGYVALKSVKWKTYITAIADCGTTNTVPFHTNAEVVGTWEKFTLVPE